MTVYLLAGGTGARMAPFADCRNKAMLPVGNVPVCRRTADACLAAGAERVVVAGWHRMGSVANLFRGEERVTVVETGVTRGSAETLARALDAVPARGDYAVLFGDCFYAPEDVAALLAAPAPAALVSAPAPAGWSDGGDWITVQTEAGAVTGFAGHDQDFAGGYRLLAGLKADGDFTGAVRCTPEGFADVPVGGMPPMERFLESAAAEYLRRGGRLAAVEAAGDFVDMDKPWHVMEANWLCLKRLTGSVCGRELGEGASIDPSAVIRGSVRLGKNSRIGRNCTVNGNLWVGDDTVIDNGAILDGDVVVGDRTKIQNYCYISGGSTIGSGCVVLHGAEFEGVLMDGAYLYHYMEIEGLIGESVDIGASCVCGTLRFDDKSAPHRVCGRRETPRDFANGTFIGDHSRTGVNCTFYPGVHIGSNTCIGPGVVVTENVPSGVRVLLRQELVTSPWGPEKYGW